MLESAYQRGLIKRLKERYPGCIILKNDPNYIQGMPDLIVLYGEHWAMLEVKASEKAAHQPNQDYWINKANTLSFAAFIYPENEEEVLHGLDNSFVP